MQIHKLPSEIVHLFKSELGTKGFIPYRDLEGICSSRVTDANFIICIANLVESGDLVSTGNVNELVIELSYKLSPSPRSELDLEVGDNSELSLSNVVHGQSSCSGDPHPYWHGRNFGGLVESFGRGRSWEYSTWSSKICQPHMVRKSAGYAHL